jgi:hypothetical protein
LTESSVTSPEEIASEYIASKSTYEASGKFELSISKGTFEAGKSYSLHMLNWDYTKILGKPTTFQVKAKPKAKVVTSLTILTKGFDKNVKELKVKYDVPKTHEPSDADYILLVPDGVDDVGGNYIQYAYASGERKGELVVSVPSGYLEGGKKYCVVYTDSSYEVKATSKPKECQQDAGEACDQLLAELGIEPEDFVCFLIVLCYLYQCVLTLLFFLVKTLLTANFGELVAHLADRKLPVTTRNKIASSLGNNCCTLRAKLIPTVAKHAEKVCEMLFTLMSLPNDLDWISLGDPDWPDYRVTGEQGVAGQFIESIGSMENTATELPKAYTVPTFKLLDKLSKLPQFPSPFLSTTLPLCVGGKTTTPEAFAQKERADGIVNMMRLGVPPMMNVARWKLEGVPNAVPIASTYIDKITAKPGNSEGNLKVEMEGLMSSIRTCQPELLAAGTGDGKSVGEAAFDKLRKGDTSVILSDMCDPTTGTYKMDPKAFFKPENVALLLGLTGMEATYVAAVLQEIAKHPDGSAAFLLPAALLPALIDGSNPSISISAHYACEANHQAAKELLMGPSGADVLAQVKAAPQMADLSYIKMCAAAGRVGE